MFFSNPQSRYIKIGAYRLPSGQFLKFSEDNSFYGGNDNVANSPTAFGSAF